MTKRRQKKTKSKLPLFLLLVITAAVIFSINLFRSTERLPDKVAFIQKSLNKNDIEILILNFNQKELTNIVVPGSAEVEVAGGLGLRKVSNLWKLAEDERKDGYLVMQTIASNFYFPIDGWVDLTAFTSRGLSLTDKLKFIFGFSGGSFNFSDRLKIGLFIYKSKNNNNLNLAQTPVLKKQSDGEETYLLTGNTSEKALSYFADDNFIKNDYKIMIRRSEEQTVVAEKIGRIVEALGTKPAYTTAGTGGEEFVCLIRTNNKYLIAKLESVFPCKLEEVEPEIFDAEIVIGKLLGKEF